LARLDQVTVDGAAVPKGAVQIVIDEATVMLPLSGVIDVGKEHARLAKDIAKLESEAGKISSKLANEQFVAKAPPEVIEEQRERLAEARQALQKLAAARDRLLSA
jgi:valyl-tRNA synthetase